MKATVAADATHKAATSTPAKLTVNPKGTSISKLAKGSKSLTVKWKKQATQTTGYQIQYSTSKTFKNGNKTVTVSKAKTVSKKISKLKAKKTYYVRKRFGVPRDGQYECLLPRVGAAPLVAGPAVIACGHLCPAATMVAHVHQRR